jgi:UDP-N-acetylglucosamine 2-epimerase (non-hydrolysing)
MARMKLLISIGTRPEAIKMAPIIMAARSIPDVRVIVVATAQHREMLDQVLDLFSIVPDFDLDVMRENQDLAAVSSNILLGVRDVLEREKPDFVLVQGDTVSAFNTALAAFYSRTPVGHVEAGLRTYDLDAPFPEEAMRQLVTRLTTLHFAPTDRNRETLLAEGVLPDSVFVTGNTVIDALYWTRDRLRGIPASRFADNWGSARAAVESNRRLILVTGHRRETFGNGIRSICMALRRIAHDYPDVEIVYPVHRNPNILSPVTELLSCADNIHLLKPLDYCSFVYLMNRAHIIISDSGGVQEEAPALGKPVLVTRVVTERQEGIECGVVKLVGADQAAIIRETEQLLNSDSYYASFARRRNPYGNGDAAAQIVGILADWRRHPAEANTAHATH